MSDKSISPHDVFRNYDTEYKFFTKGGTDSLSECGGGLKQSQVHATITDPFYTRVRKMSKLARSKYLKRLSETNPKLCNNIEICIRYHNNVLLRRKDNVIMKFGNKEFTSAFLKWAGGKSKLTEQIQNLFPFDIKGSYVEPFAGSGVVALNTKANHHWINDINDDLVLLWKTVQSSPDDLIKECLPLFSKEYNTQEKYYELRDEFNNGAKGIRRAALFIYLNRHCFNGLCRYNSKGKFNVPLLFQANQAVLNGDN
jgi:hypothetical protein